MNSTLWIQDSTYSRLPIIRTIKGNKKFELSRAKRAKATFPYMRPKENHKIYPLTHVMWETLQVLASGCANLHPKLHLHFILFF